MLGILLIDKPQGLTSHDVVAQLRRRLGLKRIGHAGTLDPLATGLLVVAVGPATRFLPYLPLEPKVYTTEALFGVETDSYDADGQVAHTRTVPSDLAARIEAELPKFRGEILQIPPVFSAIKQNGQPLYAYARKGIEVTTPPRRVFIESLSARLVAPDRAELTMTCSGGTYVRSLVHDLGQAVGCGAHVVALRRPAVGRFSVASAKAPGDVTPSDLIPLREAIDPQILLQLRPDQVEPIRHGRAITSPQPEVGPVVALLDESGEVFSMGRVEGNQIRPECVLPREVMGGTVST